MVAIRIYKDILLHCLPIYFTITLFTFFVNSCRKQATLKITIRYVCREMVHNKRLLIEKRYPFQCDCVRVFTVEKKDPPVTFPGIRRNNNNENSRCGEADEWGKYQKKTKKKQPAYSGKSQTTNLH